METIIPAYISVSNISMDKPSLWLNLSRNTGTSILIVYPSGACDVHWERSNQWQYMDTRFNFTIETLQMWIDKQIYEFAGYLD